MTIAVCSLFVVALVQLSILLALRKGTREMHVLMRLLTIRYARGDQALDHIRSGESSPLASYRMAAAAQALGMIRPEVTQMEVASAVRLLLIDGDCVSCVDLLQALSKSGAQLEAADHTIVVSETEIEFVLPAGFETSVVPLGSLHGVQTPLLMLVEANELVAAVKVSDAHHLYETLRDWRSPVQTAR